MITKMARRVLRDQPIGALLTVIFLLAALVGPLLPGMDAFSIDLRKRLMPPSSEHLLGTDEVGRDVGSRLVGGARTALIVLLLAALFGTVGIPVGLICGFYGGFIDNVISRLTDALLALPTIVLAFVIAVMLGPSLLTAAVAIGFAGIPRMTRIVRAAVLEVREEVYVEASRASGAGNWHLLFRIVLPNVLPPIVIQISHSAPMSIMWESGMSFLGIGVRPPQPSWGAMLSIAKGYLYDTPSYMIFAALAVVLTITGLNLLGDGIREVLDPLVMTRRKRG